jgi:hypothetical protein
MNVSCADGINLVYVSLYDAPLYSLNVICLDDLKLLIVHSLAVDMDLD